MQFEKDCRHSFWQKDQSEGRSLPPLNTPLRLSSSRTGGMVRGRGRYALEY